MNDHRITKGHGTGCEGFLDLLPLYEGGELDLDRADSLRDHLTTCDACHEQWDAGREAIALRQAAWTLEAGETPNLWPGIQARLRSEGILAESSPVSTRATGPGSLLHFPALRYAAAAAVLVGIAAIGWQFLGGPKAPLELPNGSNWVAEGTTPGVPEPSPLGGSEVAEIAELAPTQGLLRRMGPDDTSVLEEARPWGLEEAPAVGLRERTESMQVAGWH